MLKIRTHSEEFDQEKEQFPAINRKDSHQSWQRRPRSGRKESVAKSVNETVITLFKSSRTSAFIRYFN